MNWTNVINTIVICITVLLFLEKVIDFLRWTVEQHKEEQEE